VGYFDQQWCYEATVELEVIDTLYPPRWKAPTPFLLSFFPSKDTLDGGMQAIFLVAEIESPRGNSFQLQGQMHWRHPIALSGISEVREALETCKR
jgi:hypothetical protein